MRYKGVPLGAPLIGAAKATPYVLQARENRSRNYNQWVSSPTRRELLKAGLAAVPGVALSRFGLDPENAWMADQASAQGSHGFPVPALQRHGDSSVGAALRSGKIPQGSTLSAVEQALRLPPQSIPRFDPRTGERNVPEGFARVHSPEPIAALRARFPHLRRHFVFEYYAWYETNPYFQWAGKDLAPPYQIASNLMPALGPYHSMDAKVVEQHARWMADSGVGAIAISWWGPDSNTNRATPLIMDVMKAHDIHVTFHLEPYGPNRATSYAADINYLLREYGEKRRWDNFLLLEQADGTSTPVFKSFRTILPRTVVDCQGIVQTVPDYVTDDVWRRQTDAVRENAKPLFSRVVLLADSLDVGRTKAGGFDGIAIYDSYVRPATWPQAASDFGGNNLLYSFAINCGFDGYFPSTPAGICDVPLAFEPPVGPIDWTSAASRKSAENASRARIIESLDTTLALQADPTRGNWAKGFFLTYVTTFNEWYEGTSFEPAKSRAALLAQELPFKYHNPDNGSWRLELLKTLLAPITGGR